MCCHIKQVNIQNTQNGWTSLHYACNAQHISIVKTLLMHDADPTIMDHNNEYPFDIARKHNNMQIQKLITNKLKENGKTLSQATISKNVKQIVEEIDNYDETAPVISTTSIPQTTPLSIHFIIIIFNYIF